MSCKYLMVSRQAALMLAVLALGLALSAGVASANAPTGLVGVTFGLAAQGIPQDTSTPTSVATDIASATATSTVASAATATGTTTATISPTATNTPTATPTPCSPGWRAVPSANGGSIGNELHGVSTLTANDVWAVGYYFSGGVYKTLIEHWDGSAWSVVPSPNQGSSSSYLNAVSTLSPGDAWAVGYSGTQTLIEHWNGSVWSVVPSPNQGSSDNMLAGVAAISANDVWAVGKSGSQTLTEHWNGSGWVVVPSPNSGAGGNSLNSVSGRASNDVWAVGSYFVNANSPPQQTLIEHWDGSSWTAVVSPNEGSGDNVLSGVSVTTTDDVWAVGSYANNNTPQTLAEHWDGATWNIVASPNNGATNNTLQGVSSLAQGDVWAVGYYYSSTSNFFQTLIEHWDGTQWTVTASPSSGSTSSRLFAVSARASNDVWAVGKYDSMGGQTLIEHYGGSCGCNIVFGDVPPGSTFYPYIRCLACKNIISGYACGSPGEPCDPASSPYFRPNNNVTRSQIAKIVSNSAGFAEDPGAQVYEDVPPSNDFYAYINRLSNRGYMGGYQCGSVPAEPCIHPLDRPYFRPFSSATRGQLAKIVSNTAQNNDDAGSQIYEDVPPGSTFYVWVNRLSNLGVMSGYECGGPSEPCNAPLSRPYFRPLNSVTRGQTSKIVANTFFPGCQPGQR